MTAFSLNYVSNCRARRAWQAGPVPRLPDLRELPDYAVFRTK
jgi:hypothetical protein